MGSLSNFLRRGDASPVRRGTDLAGAVHCRAALQGEVGDCLKLILGSHGRYADNNQVLDFLQFALHRRINLDDLWLAERGGRTVWSILPIVSPGRTMLFLTPTHHPTPLADPAPTLLADAICTHFATRGVRLAQALIEPTDTAARGQLEGTGFKAMAGLDYLHAGVRRTFQPPKLPSERMSWVRYSDQTQALFRDTVAASYRGSLDCPALNGLRDMDDVMAGHQASGEFDPSLWFLLCETNGDGEPIPLGVLLLARMTKNEATELVYLGLTPEARGKGLGDLLVRQALAATAASGFSRLSLAVDGANRPALSLYHRHGFQHIGRKLAMMRILDAAEIDASRQMQVARR